MKLYRLNDQSLYESRQFVIGDQVYPAGWLATATEDELAALGIVVETVYDPPPLPSQIYSTRPVPPAPPPVAG